MDERPTYGNVPGKSRYVARFPICHKCPSGPCGITHQKMHVPVHVAIPFIVYDTLVCGIGSAAAVSEGDGGAPPFHSALSLWQVEGSSGC